MAKEMTMKQYIDNKVAFYRKHSGESGYRERGDVEGATIRKAVCFEDGAVWNEVTEPVFENIDAVVHGLKVKMIAKMYRTEVWDSDNPISRFVYEIAHEGD